jgi:hypothetical protein
MRFEIDFSLSFFVMIPGKEAFFCTVFRKSVDLKYPRRYSFLGKHFPKIHSTEKPTMNHFKSITVLFLYRCPPCGKLAQE